jgi:hypothetical protein
MRFRSLTVLFFGLTWLACGPSLAEPEAGARSKVTQSSDTPIRAVLELFTSQGCSSCPPADVVLKAYANDPTVIALSLPVDYWDYLGWKDTFASPRNSERQRAYAKARGDGAIYTPQIVVNGILHANGAVKADIENAIDLTSKNSAQVRVPLRFWQENNTLNIAAGWAPEGTEVREATIWLAAVQMSGTVEIQKGENAGQALKYTNIVRELTPIGLWKGKPLMIQIPRSAVMQAATQKSVVLVQEGKAGPIIGAAWAGLW